jgi:hypothetical protein
MAEKQGICIVCEEAFTYEVKRGRQPKLCASKECRSIHRKAVRKPATPVVRKQKCAGCDTIIVKHGRGQIKWCEPCRKEMVKKQNKQYRDANYKTVVRTQGNCVDCGCSLGVKTGRGNPKKRCIECQKTRRRKQARDSAKRCYTNKVRTYKCFDCNKTFEQQGKGKLRKKCPTCVVTTVQPEVVMSEEARKLWNALE